MSHFVISASVASLNAHIKICFLKEIGFSNHFVIRKSEKIVKIEMILTKRHLPILDEIFVKITVKLDEFEAKSTFFWNAVYQFTFN